MNLYLISIRTPLTPDIESIYEVLVHTEDEATAKELIESKIEDWVFSEDPYVLDIRLVDGTIITPIFDKLDDASSFLVR